MKNIFKDKEKEKEKELKELVKSIETKELRNEIKDKENFIEVAQKEFNKRPDRKIKEVIGNSFKHVLDYALIVFFFGIIMLGVIPSYFNVNDEFLNPTINISVNESFEILTNTGYTIVKTFHDIGVKRPKVFFWLFWVTVFIWLVLPIIDVIIFIYKKHKKGGQKINGHRRHIK